MCRNRKEMKSVGNQITQLSFFACPSFPSPAIYIYACPGKCQYQHGRDEIAGGDKSGFFFVGAHAKATLFSISGLGSFAASAKMQMQPTRLAYFLYRQRKVFSSFLNIFFYGYSRTNIPQPSHSMRGFFVHFAAV